MIALLIANLIVSSLILLILIVIGIASVLVNRRKKRALAQFSTSLAQAKAGNQLAELFKTAAASTSEAS